MHQAAADPIEVLVVTGRYPAVDDGSKVVATPERESVVGDDSWLREVGPLLGDAP